MPILLTHLATTIFLCGLIWFVQLVHYPLFLHTGPDAFPRYEIEHARRTTWVVAPAMFVELVTGVWLVVRPPDGVPVAFTQWGLGLLAILWLSTAFLQVPRHRQLAAGFDEQAARSLVRSNWIRTLAWSLRAVLVMAMLAVRAHRD